VDLRERLTLAGMRACELCLGLLLSAVLFGRWLISLITGK
jgi:hypothetical protein